MKTKQELIVSMMIHISLKASVFAYVYPIQYI